MTVSAGEIETATVERFIAVDDFARSASLSRRTIDLYRHDRPTGFTRENDLSRGAFHVRASSFQKFCGGWTRARSGDAPRL